MTVTVLFSAFVALSVQCPGAVVLDVKQVRRASRVRSASCTSCIDKAIEDSLGQKDIII